MTSKERKIQEVIDRLDGYETLTDDQIIAEFGDAEAAILTWKHARRRIGDELHLLSKTGKPATGRLSTSLTGERKPTPVLAVSISNTRGFAHKFLVGR